MPARFPRLRPDGSFCVKVTVEADTRTPEALAARFASWAEKWVRDNADWAWPNGRRLNYFDDFAGLPRSITCDGKRLSFHLDGKVGAKWWKDWIVFRLLEDAQKAFPEIGRFDGIEDGVD